jgi:hypothetical protein
MQQIARGANSILVMTLNEKQTLANPTFLFRFINEAANTEKCFISTDLSSYPERYNRFLITEVSSGENLTSGVVTLTEGIHEYRVYEQTSTTNLLWQMADNQTPLEIGLAKVTGTPSTAFTHNHSTTTFKWPTNP